MNKRRKPIIPFLLIFIIGAGILFYPKISFWWAEYNQVTAVQSYEKVISGMTPEEKDAEWEKARDYNERMAASIVKDPFADTENIDPFDRYYDTLDVGDGIMGYVEIPSIHVMIPIYHGTGEAILEKGVGHIKATALPIGGTGTHSVLTGHTGLHTAKLFTDLVEVKPGEKFYIDVLGRTLAYEVDQIEVVEPDDISKLAAVEGEDHITLVTCTPYGVNSHRLLVRGTRCEYIEDERNNDSGRVQFPWWVLLLILFLTALLLIIGSRLQKRAGKKKVNGGRIQRKSDEK